MFAESLSVGFVKIFCVSLRLCISCQHSVYFSGENTEKYELPKKAQNNKIANDAGSV